MSERKKSSFRIDGELAMDTQACADWMGCTPVQIRTWRDRGYLPYRKLGGRVLYLRSEIAEFLKRLEGRSLEEALENADRRK